MRLTTAILIASMLQVSASTLAQKFTYVKKRVTLNMVFKELSNQTNYNLVWNEKEINAETVIDANFRKATIEEVLNKCLSNLPLKYSIKNNIIVIKKDEPSLTDKILNLFNVIDVRGRVVDENNEPLMGAVVKIKGTGIATSTNSKGEFSLSNVDDKAILLISFLGYEPQEITVTKNMGEVRLVMAEDRLKEVEILSTGYQDIPKERATGSFTIVDNKTINRSVGINILDRLEGVTNGLLLNRGLGAGNNSKISVHGRSTLFAEVEPLIVLNGFPYDGTIDQINPADIETINVLKDAAASSIWGARSGNGVIVITTKSGGKNQRLKIGASSTLTVSDHADLYYTPQMSSSDFIDLEQHLFAKGLYTSRFSNPYNAVSSAVEIFNQRKLNRISAADSTAQINALKANDVRKDINQYVYRNKVQQQYQLNISGGGANYQYYMSGGYDKNLESKIADSYERVTININNRFSMLNDKLSLSGDISYVVGKTNSGNSYNPYSPYEKLVDDNGHSLPTVLRSSGFRLSYLDTAGNGKLLDWYYRPKDEVQNPNTRISLTQYRMKVGVSYKILDDLTATANYQYLSENQNSKLIQGVESYYTRNLINQYSSISAGNVNRVIPLGSTFNSNNSELISKIFRAQLNYNKKIDDNNEVNAIMGYEGRDTGIGRNGQIYYGYDTQTLTNVNGTINPLNDYKLYYSSGSSRISTSPSASSSKDVNQSYYFNASYSYYGRYILSGSARRDESNLFGVKTNQKGVPLWSLGMAWNLNQEKFYSSTLFPVLKFRLTYGYNGNVDNSVSAYLVSKILDGVTNVNGDQYSVIQNPPNPALRWEKVKTWNVGLDFAFKDRITGSLDIYQKRSFDLISNNPIALQSGVSQFRGNGANLQTRGLDLMLSSRNLTGRILWNTSLIFNYNQDKVTSYKVKESSNSNIVSGNYNNPLEGYPYNAIFTYPSAGLDATGAPQGYLYGSISKDYAKIGSIFDPTQLRYHGSTSPRIFGSLINTVLYKDFELSFNIVYKFDYYFGRNSVFSGSNYGSATTGVDYKLADYEKRWQKPGDELITNIPALIYPAVSTRNSFFANSDELVEKGDHFRLQDIKLSYNISQKQLAKLLLKNANIFLYARNLGILWRKNSHGIDPDYGSTGIPQPFSGSIGINLTL